MSKQEETKQRLPRDTRFHLRANTGLKSLAMKEANSKGESLADYIERLIMDDLRRCAE